MFRTSSHRTLDMTQGPIFSQVIFFALPIMLSGILQLLFNAADTIVVGRFAGSEALAAVGSVGSLNNLLISLFMRWQFSVYAYGGTFTLSIFMAVYLSNRPMNSTSRQTWLILVLLVLVLLVLHGGLIVGDVVIHGLSSL